MKIYAVTLKPLSAFGTPLKGDTLFGHFCWQAVFDPAILKNSFDHWIEQYQHKPFAVFSSAWPKLTDEKGLEIYCLPKPALPAGLRDDMTRQEKVKQRKELKKRKWLLVSSTTLVVDLHSCSTIDDSELSDKHIKTLTPEQERHLRFLPKEARKPIITAPRTHNSIDRRTMTTGEGFDPFTMDNFYYLPGLELVVFVGIEEEALTVDQLRLGFERMGQCGFGRDGAIGLGRFNVGDIKQINWPEPVENTGCYTLAPCVPEAEKIKEHFGLPFTRFGRHGGNLALSGNPFKNPIIMADEGAVFFFGDGCLPTQPYIGKGLRDISLVEKRTVAQGYSLYLPITGEFNGS